MAEDKQKFDRNASGKMDFPEGTGGITFATPLFGDFNCLEIFKIDVFMRVKMAEQTDPQKKNPHLKHSRKVSYEYGSNNEILARLLIQTSELIGLTVLSKEKKEDIITKTRVCTVGLINAQKIVQELNKEIEDKENKGIEEPTSIVIPSVENIQNRAKDFLIHSKSYLRSIIIIINVFFDENFKEAHFHKVKEWCEVKFGNSDQLTEFLNQFGPFIKMVIDLRDSCEHINSCKLEIKNFEMDQDGQVLKPKIIFKGVKGDCEYDIEDDLNLGLSKILDKLIDFGEFLNILTISKFLPENIPLQIMKIPKNDIDEEKPFRYRMDFHIKEKGTSPK